MHAPDTLNIFILSKDHFVKELVSQLCPKASLIPTNQAQDIFTQINLKQHNIIITEEFFSTNSLELLIPVIEIGETQKIKHSLFLSIPFMHNDLLEKIKISYSSFLNSRKFLELKENIFLFFNKNKILIKNSQDVEVITLTTKEIELLKFLYEQPNKSASKTLIQKTVFGYKNEIESHTVETHISRIRNKSINLAKLITLNNSTSYTIS